mmetsp:Transcript_32232/g.96637  ORF Transcript_32232/g.96637 Transcript_32232/m.96637 type:complete len:548 (-) Transcript_32232:2392-4035(-)|eukprot:CAMPEP_0113574090 /NCGR_PEP_ID=MMETSP0015_2-20120614/26962_1 /TAXON_ID=2838 /ORGANISM="Odontella" /LENGTH=547 /DNA_ID=CAMNT_0000477205 /DNA_START=35 /DNA_END=1678 /DNA_ORIENTATION=+ /assembly_acc=CAM_ASM_000160
MTSLPPYSTFRTDNKQMKYPQATSHGNILTFTPPGFKQTLNVKFPDSRLAVCEKCKKNYKTRDMCRVRNNHTTAPWTTAFICITLDASCTDDDGKYVDKPLTVRMVQWQPYCVKKAFGPKTPVCSSCKKTNRTRSFCRDRHQHKQLPWCTVYVMLSAVDSTDPTTVVAAPSKPLEDGNEGTEAGAEKSENGEATEAGEGTAFKAEENDSSPDKKDDATPETKKPAASSTESKKGKTSPKKSLDDAGDDINDIDESRTFLAQVSCRSNTIHWLELTDYDPSTAPTVNLESHVQALSAVIRNPSMAVPVDPSQYYAQMASMGYTPQQIQAIMVQNQHYYQMHQQSYAAQHAAWQASYNQQLQQMAGQTQVGAAPAAASGVAPQQPQAAPVAAPQVAPVAVSAGTPAVMPAPEQGYQHPPPLPPPSVQAAPVTAGEAAAAKQQEQKLSEDNAVAEGTQTAANTDTADAAQQQAQAQWHAHIMYQQQLYQQQLHMQQAAQQGAPAQGSDTGTTAHVKTDDAEHQDGVLAPVGGSDDDNEEIDAKRPRIEAL